MRKKPCPLTVMAGMVFVLIASGCSRSAPGNHVPLSAAATRNPCSGREPLQGSVKGPENDEFSGGNISGNWIVKNSGLCDWPDGVELVYVSGDVLGSIRSVQVPPLAAGESAQIVLKFVGPGQTGTYLASWRLRAPDGTLFGDPVPIRIVIVTPTAFPALEGKYSNALEPTRTPSPWSYGPGDTGPTVAAIQYLLRSDGYTLEADSVFGPITEAAVKRFQELHGLEANGTLDLATWKKLTGEHELRLGDSGDAVKAVQFLLVHVQGCNLMIDGDFGKDTRSAVIDFQSAHMAFFQDGIVDESTWFALTAGD